MTSNYFELVRNCFLFVSYVITSCTGLYYLKAASSWWSAQFAVGCVLYGVGAILWLFILRILPLSVAFPLAAGALMIGTTLTGVVLLKEIVTSGHIFGVLLISLGIFAITMMKSQNP